MKMENRTEYEIRYGLSSRCELREHILGMFDDLPEDDFHSLYNMLWKIHAKNLLIKLKSDRVKELKED